MYSEVSFSMVEIFCVIWKIWIKFVLSKLNNWRLKYKFVFCIYNNHGKLLIYCIINTVL